MRQENSAGYRAAWVAAAAGSMSLLLLAGPASAGATTASSARPAFSADNGSVLPNRGGEAEIGLSCPSQGHRACRGSVALMARRGTAQTLGSRPLARASFTLSPGSDSTLRLRLSPPARHALSRGPLYVTAVLRAAASTASVNVIAKRPETLALERPFSPTQALRAASAGASHDCWPDAHCIDFTWSWKIPAAHYLVMKSFSCPANEPRVAPGRPVPVQGRKDKWWNTFKGELKASASDGVGYAGFHQANISEFDDTEARFKDYVSLYNMLGWPQGGLLENSVWAPLLRDGTFSLKVTCTSAQGYGAAYLTNNASHVDQMFFPWFATAG